MFRLAVLVLALIAIFEFDAQADQLKGKVKAVAADKNEITVTVGKTDQQFTIPADAKVLNAAGKEIPQRLGAKLFQPGMQVVVTTDKVDGKDVVKELKLLDPFPPNGFLDTADAGPDFLVQGEYEGTIAGKGKLGAQVVAGGEGQFAVLFFAGGLPGAGWDGKTIEKAAAKTVDEKTAVTGKWHGAIASGKLTGKTADGEEFTLVRCVRHSSTEGAKPPSGAVVLFDGSKVDEWNKGKIVDGEFLLAGATTKRAVGDFKMHLEFRLPFRDRDEGNSGVYMQERYELQIINSFGKFPPGNGGMASIYTQTPPSVNICFPPLSWQTYDIEFKAARWDGNKKISNARVTLLHNGVKVHDDADIKDKTGAGKPEGPQPLPIYLQHHGSPVYFRNVWLLVPSAS
ncbi:hypothetical protein AYO44_16390 [Planctomycetaceae bacterium SCGC AG-212-F19]|nr:hypothetical protein AYO44_16390 [Planctomycetaceae bacterium SCGC AG-212-F19]